MSVYRLITGHYKKVLLVCFIFQWQSCCCTFHNRIAITTAPNVRALLFPWLNWQLTACAMTTSKLMIYLFIYFILVINEKHSLGLLKNQDHLLKNPYVPFFAHQHFASTRRWQHNTIYKIHEYSFSPPHDFLFHLSEKKERLSHERRSSLISSHSTIKWHIQWSFPLTGSYATPRRTH